MRAELEILEKIDLYLRGQMSGTEAAGFKAQIANDPSLQAMVDNQKLMIKTVNRQALLSEINAVAGAAGSSAWYSNVTTWIVTGIIGASIVAGFIFYNPEVPQLVENIIVDENPIVQDANTDLIIDTSQVEVDSIFPPPPPEFYPIDYTLVLSTVNNMNNYPIDLPMGDFELIPLSVEIIDTTTLEDLSYESEMKKNQKAQFPGGAMPMKRYFDKNLKFPGTAKKKGIEGNVRVNFWVYASGVVEVIRADCFTMKSGAGENKPLSGFKVMMNLKVKKLFEKEAKRLFRLMPCWEPATDKFGTPMTVPMEMLIDFDINGNSKAYDLDFDKSQEGVKTTEG